MKKLLISLVILTAFVTLPIKALSQRNDNWFKTTDDYENRADFNTGSTGLGTQGFGQEPQAPLGSGLLILTAIGAGYALTKSKKMRKKAGLMVMAFAMLMGMTQCKKNVPTVNNNTPVLEGETVHITLTVNSAGDSTRYQVMPNANIAPVKFEVNDTIFVAYNGKHAGFLTCSSLSTIGDQNGNKLGIFSGDITLSQVGDQPLHFFFLGNRKEGNGLSFISSGGFATGYEIDITDQTKSLPVISYGKSKQNYDSGVTNYTLEDANGNWLLNQCALVKFTSTNIYHNGTNSVDNNDDALYTTNKQITIYGVNNKMKIDLTTKENEMFTPTFTPSQINNGEIRLNNKLKATREGDEVRYAIVLAGDYSDEKDLDVAFDYANDKYGFTGTYQIGKEVAINDYCNDAELRLVWHSGAFSIGTGKVAVFSRGNLQYNDKYNTNTPAKAWRFAKHQYDYVGGMDGALSNKRIGNVVLDETSQYCDPGTAGHWSQNDEIGKSTYTGWIDLYGWGTAENPTKKGGAASNYTWSKDWGENYISNSGLTNTDANKNYWVTMTKLEWPAFFSSALELHHIGFATVAGVKGVVIFPDNFNAAHTTQSGTFTPLSGTGSNLNFDANVYTTEGWKTMEENGAVFLPAAGYRGLVQAGPSNYASGPGYDQEFGIYWSSSTSKGQPTTQSCYFAWGPGLTGSQTFELDGDRLRYVGHAVRLVHVITTSGSK